MQNFKVLNFKTFTIEPHTRLVYGRRGAHQIADPNLYESIVRLEAFTGQRVDQNTISSCFGQVDLDEEKIFSHLREDLKLIREYQEHPPLTNLLVVSDSPFVSDLLTTHFKTQPIYNANIVRRPIAADENTLVLLFQEKYDGSVVRDLYRIQENRANPIVSAYLFERYLVIDSLFVPEEYLPCHFCNFLNLSEQARVGNQPGQMEFIHFYQSMLTKHQVSVPALPITDLQRALVTSVLFPIVRTFLAPDEPFNSEDRYSIHYLSRVDLESGHCQKEISTHHPLCPECLQDGE